MDNQKNNIKQRIKEAVSDVSLGAEVILYGSRARGDEKAGSDWDLLVLIDGEAGVTVERKIRDKLYDLELESGEVFSLFVYSKKDWLEKQSISPYFQSVTNEGIEL